MTCNVILSFLLIFHDGHTETRTKWMTRNVAEMFVDDMKHSESLKRTLKEHGIDETKDYNIKDVAPYDCAVGPGKDKT